MILWKIRISALHALLRAAGDASAFSESVIREAFACLGPKADLTIKDRLGRAPIAVARRSKAYLLLPLSEHCDAKVRWFVAKKNLNSSTYGKPRVAY